MRVEYDAHLDRIIYAGKAIGIVEVASFAASTESVAPGATSTATGRRTNSAARAGNRSDQPCVHRYSITTLRRSTKPVSTQALPECCYAGCQWFADPLCRKAKRQHRRLLRSCCERPRGCRAGQASGLGCGPRWHAGSPLLLAASRNGIPVDADLSWVKA